MVNSLCIIATMSDNDGQSKRALKTLFVNNSLRNVTSGLKTGAIDDTITEEALLNFMMEKLF